MWTELDRRGARRAAGGVALALALAGCEAAHLPRDPLPYSPNYSRSGEAVSGGRGVVRKGYDRADAAGSAATGALVPDACITPDVAEQPFYLPPGCANNLNLQMMVERQEDLLHGRRTGPAMAAPVARAARRYIDEEPRPPAETPQRGTDTTQSQQ